MGFVALVVGDEVDVEAAADFIALRVGAVPGDIARDVAVLADQMSANREDFQSRVRW